MKIHDLSGDWGSLRLTELGACVLSWRPAGRDDVLLPPPPGDVVPGRMWHGGIPVCAPWFGVGRGAFEVPFPHGLVARVPWTTTSVVSDPDGARVVLDLSSADVAHLPGAEHYPADLGYRVEVSVGPRRLEVSLTIGSPSLDAVVDVALHPYLACDASSAVVEGLAGAHFRDFAAGAAPGVEDGAVAVGRHLDRVYSGAAPLRLIDATRTVRLSPAGARNTVVWNPGPAGLQVPEDGWRRFACVEYGCVQGDAVRIPAGGSHRLGLALSV